MRPRLASSRLNRAWVVAKEAEKNISPRVLGFAVMAVPVDRQPIDRVAVLILPIRIALMMLHVDDVVIGLRKTAGDGLGDPKKPIEELRTEERVMNEVVTDAVDVGVDHQRINESQDQHDPERRVREKEVEAEQIGEMKQARQRWALRPSAYGQKASNSSSGAQLG